MTGTGRVNCTSNVSSLSLQVCLAYYESPFGWIESCQSTTSCSNCGDLYSSKSLTCYAGYSWRTKAYATWSGGGSSTSYSSQVYIGSC